MPPREQYAERTEQPTKRRRREAKRRGQVAHSSDLGSALLLVGGVVLVGAFAPKLLASLTAMTAGMLRSAGPASAIDTGPVTTLVLTAGGLLASLAVLAGAAHLVQVGLPGSAVGVRPNAERINPAAGLRRLLSGRSAIRGALAVAKIAAVAAVGWFTGREALGELAGAANLPADQIAARAGGLTMRMGMRIGVALLALAAIDYAWQRWAYERDLKMTRREYLEERRADEGDPLIRSRRTKLRAARRDNAGERTDG